MLKMDPESEYHFHVNKELSDETIVSLNSRKRNTVKWLPTKGHIRGVVVIAHGLHEHSLRYSDLAHALTTKGFAVFAIDHEGHGHSGDVHGLVSDWRHLSEDFVSFTEAVHAQFPTLPIMMFGHSMGTSIVIQSAEHLNYIKVWFIFSELSKTV
jgi:alpha-beta hydrolase superfamily lysophospholipase